MESAWVVLFVLSEHQDVFFLDAQQLQQYRQGFYNQRLQLNSKKTIIQHSSPQSLAYCRLDSCRFLNPHLIKYIRAISTVEVPLNKPFQGCCIADSLYV